MAGNFWDRLRRLYGPQTQPSRNVPATPPPAPTPYVPSQQQMAPQPTAPQHGPLDNQEKMNLIVKAGQSLHMLEIKYDGVSRLVEPYSFRNKGSGLLFFGYCSIHRKIHSFKIEKIEDIKISEFPYAPRWDVEM